MNIKIERQNYRPRQVYKDGFSDPTGYQLLIALFILCLLALWGLMIATNRVCDKPFSSEFKTTQTYKNLKCD